MFWKINLINTLTRIQRKENKTEFSGAGTVVQW